MHSSAYLLPALSMTLKQLCIISSSYGKYQPIFSKFSIRPRAGHHFLGMKKPLNRGAMPNGFMVLRVESPLNGSDHH